LQNLREAAAECQLFVHMRLWRILHTCIENQLQGPKGCCPCDIPLVSDADSDSEDEEYHPTTGWDPDRPPPLMSDCDDDSDDDAFTLKEGNNTTQRLTINY
jgi:hypothetical protein